MVPENGTSTNGAKDANGTSKVHFDENSTIPLWLDGAETLASNGTFPITSPSSSKHLWNSTSCGSSDISSAISSAAAAQPIWAAIKPNARRDILMKAADIFNARWGELSSITQSETGSNDMVTNIDQEFATQVIKNIAGLAQTISGSVPTVGDQGRSAMILREPFGVVLAIVPWNMPYVLGFRAILAPIAAGNSVVLKGSEMCPAVFWAIGSVLHEAGLPPGVLNTVVCKREDAAKITQELIRDKRVAKVNFTGSTAIGRAIGGMCGKELKPVIMELGGKAPTIVCEDANIEEAATGTALGAFFHGGQICMSAERAIVHSSIVEPFKEALRGAVKSIFGNADGLNLIAAAPVAKNHALIKNAREKGASTVYEHDSNGSNVNTAKNSARMTPIIVEGVKEGMDLYQTESFGPTLSFLVYETEEEALRIANDTDYGLSSAIYTEDLRKGLRMAKGIVSGAVHLNHMTIHDESVLPHGGTKASGFGRFNAEEGLQEWTRTKVITWKD